MGCISSLTCLRCLGQDLPLTLNHSKLTINSALAIQIIGAVQATGDNLTREQVVRGLHLYMGGVGMYVGAHSSLPVPHGQAPPNHPPI